MLQEVRRVVINLREVKKLVINRERMVEYGMMVIDNRIKNN